MIKNLLDDYSSHLETTVSYKRALIAINNLSPIYKCTPRNVTKAIDQYLSTRKASAGTINREISVLQAALRWSFKRGNIDFVPTLPRMPSPKPRSQFLTEVEARGLVDACKPYPWLEAFVKIALMTGQRKEAILSLKWEQVDFNTGLVDFNDATISMAHRRKGRGIVPMSEGLRKFLMGLDKSHPYVITKNGSRVRDFRAVWTKIMHQTGLDITPHVLRHTVATQLAQKNVPMTQISRLLGHKSTAITERVYAKFTPDFCKQAVVHLNV
jgi:integrase